MYLLRKELLYFSNALTPLTDSLGRFMEKESPFYRQTLAPYYADLYEHLHQIADSIRAYREMSNGLHEPSAFWIFVAACLAVAGGMLGYFKLKRW